MRRLLACALLFLGCAAPELTGQGLSAAGPSSPAKPQRLATAKDPAKPRAQPKNAEKDPIKSAVGETALPPNQPIMTEIFADEAFFDSPNHIGIFTGHVIVNDPRFNVQAEKLTIYLSKTQEPTDPQTASSNPAQSQALEKAVAEGNVGVVRERADEKGGPPVRSVGRSDMAVYTTSDGKVELRGTPRVQSGLNMHVATSPDTVMVLEQGGQLTTKGPSRTEIRQEPKVSPTPGAVPPKP